MTISRRAKRCPQCHRMIAVGEPVVLSDDRYRTDAIDAAYGGWSDVRRSYARGAWHSWHPECRRERLAQQETAERESLDRTERDLAELRAVAETFR